MLRLFPEQERSDRAFTALTRFLDLLDDLPAREGVRPELDALGLGFQLKLLWVAGDFCRTSGVVPNAVR